LRVNEDKELEKREGMEATAVMVNVEVGLGRACTRVQQHVHHVIDFRVDLSF
jgi:hypothetical protein